MKPDTQRVRSVLSIFHEDGLGVGLGGSGLLHALGLTEVVNDWDLTTDEPLDSVMKVLKGFKVVLKSDESETFCSDYILTLPEEGIEIIGGYTIRCGSDLCRLPSIRGGTRGDIPIASPEVWAVAYHLMGRLEKSELLFGYLKRTGVRRGVVELLLKEPLPKGLRGRLVGMLGLSPPNESANQRVRSKWQNT